MLSLFQRRDRDATGLPGGPSSARLTTSIDFAVFTCGRNDTPKSRHVLAHARDVVIQTCAIEHQRRRFEIRKLHRWRRDVNGTRMRRL